MNQWRLMAIMFFFFAFTGVCFAEPITLAALLPSIIAGGTALAGQGLAGIGAGLAGKKAAEQERLKREREAMEADRLFNLRQQEQRQTLGMQGISTLAQLRGSAMDRYKQQMFRNDFLRAVGGA